MQIDISAEETRAELDAILASATFERSERLRRFLPACDRGPEQAE